MTHILLNLNLKFKDLAIKEINEYIEKQLEKVRIKYNIFNFSSRIIIIKINSKEYNIEKDSSQKEKNKAIKNTIKLINKIKLKNLSLIKNIDIIEKIIEIKATHLDNNNNNNNNNNKEIIEKYKNKKIIIKKKYKLEFFNYQNINKKIKSIYKKEIFEEITTKKSADLKNPKFIMNIYFENNIIILTRNIITKNIINFKMNNLPGFMPTVTEPLLSNTLFNLSDIKKNTIIIDPFCGIGGFFIQNPYIKNKKILNELHQDVIKKLKENLKYLKVKNYKITNYDGLKISNKLNHKKHYVTITDVPYGKSCKMQDDNFTFFKKFLNDSKKYSESIVIVVPLFKKNDEEKYEEIINKNSLKIKIKHTVFVNKSLSKLILKITK